jgi:hypothetical protein
MLTLPIMTRIWHTGRTGIPSDYVHADIDRGGSRGFSEIGTHVLYTRVIREL